MAKAVRLTSQELSQGESLFRSIQAALRAGDLEKAEALYNIGEVDWQDVSKATPLHLDEDERYVYQSDLRREMEEPFKRLQGAVFIEGLRAGDGESVVKLVRDGYRHFPDVCDPEGRTLLHIAMASGLDDTVKKMIALNSDALARDDYGGDIYACAPGGPDSDFAVSVRRWVEEFYRTNVPREQEYALGKAIRDKSLATVNALLAGGARPHAYADRRRNNSSDYRTLMNDAAASGSVEIMAAMLVAGGDLNSPGRFGSFPPGGDEPTDCMVPPLTVAALHRDVPMMSLLLQNGANPNGCAPGSITALMTAAYVKNLEAVELLIEAGADLDALYNEGCSALYFSVEKNFGRKTLRLQFQEGKRIIKALLRAGAKRIGRFNTEQFGNVVWHWLVTEDRVPARRALEEMDSLPQLIPKYLGDYGFCFDGKNRLPEEEIRKNFTAYNCHRLFELAAILDDANMAECIYDQGKFLSRGNAMFTAAENGSAQVVEYLLRTGCPPDFTKPEEWAAILTDSPEKQRIFLHDPMTEAARSGFPEVIRILVKAAGDSVMTRIRMANAIVCAIREGHREAVTTLLDLGCDLERPANWDDRSPLKVAYDAGKEEIATLLIERGALPQTRDDPDDDEEESD